MVIIIQPLPLMLLVFERALGRKREAREHHVLPGRHHPHTPKVYPGGGTLQAERLPNLTPNVSLRVFLLGESIHVDAWQRRAAGVDAIAVAPTPTPRGSGSPPPVSRERSSG